VFENIKLRWFVLPSLLTALFVISIPPVVSWAGALEDAQERVRQNPNDTQAHAVLGYTYSKSGRYEEAIVSYKEAIRVNPTHPKIAAAHYNLGNAYDELGRYEEAIVSYKEAIRLKPDDAKVHFNLGNSYANLGQYQDAIASYKESIQINPTQPKIADAHAGLGLAYKRLGRHKEAIAEYKEALRIRPDLSQARNQLNELEQKLPDERLARERLPLEEERKKLEALRLAEENNKKVEQHYAKVIEIDKKPEESISADSKVRVWEEFLGKYKEIKPYAEKASKRLKYWGQLARLSPDERKLFPSINMVLVSGGCFMMGANNKVFNENEQPVHEVCLSSFYIDIYEVTQEEYEKVTGKNPSFFVGSDLPVEEVTWDDANNYCVAVNKRLPTEAEWEYAARHKAVHKYHWGEEIGTANANCNGCGSEWDNVKTAVVGSFESNSLGIYDMAGNVWEWVSDWYDAGYYATSPKQDPKGAPSGTAKSLRGGSWASIPNTLRITNRFRSYPDNKRNYRGFRCAK
jgi:formylglycine-generating enzyme required for sulfatase activity/Flp pilus assembly protein TadD